MIRPYINFLSRQTESVRDHKFHSGYAHSLMVYRQGALYCAPASNSRVTEGEWCISVSVLFANAFRNEAMSVSSERNEVAVCPLSNFESRLYLPALFSANFKPTACRYKIEI